METNVWAEMTLQASMEYNKRHVWFYFISTSIGNFAVIEWERKDLCIERKMFDVTDYSKVEQYYKKKCLSLIKDC